MRAASAVLQSTRALVLGGRAQGLRRRRRARTRTPRATACAIAWPSAEWGSLPIEGGIEAAYKAEIEAAPDPAAKRAEIEARIRSFARRSAPPRRFDVEEIIDPRDTRPLLCEFADLAAPLRTPGRSAFGVRP